MRRSSARTRAGPRARATGSRIDVASEQAVRESLTTAAPEIAFFGEEGGGERGEVGWFVDPLDGTANFLHGFPMVGVSIGLVAVGEPVVGVIAAPILGAVYCGAPWWGSVPRRHADPRQHPSTEAAIPATGFPFRAKRDRLDEYLPVFEPRIAHVRRSPPRRVPRASTSPGRPRACSTATSSSSSEPGMSRRAE